MNKQMQKLNKKGFLECYIRSELLKPSKFACKRQSYLQLLLYYEEVARAQKQ